MSADRRSSPRPGEEGRDRRRWNDFRAAYPGILATFGVALLLMVAVDLWLVYKGRTYAAEVQRLRAGMSDVERRKVDAALATEQNRLRVMVELARRQAQLDKQLHLSVSVDSAVMYLEREGALLREMRVDVGPERWVGTPPDTVKMTAPRGARTIERLLEGDAVWEVPAWVYRDRGLPVPESREVAGALGTRAIVLNGGTVIYAPPESGPLADSLYVLPGAIRARASDLRALAPNLAAGMTVYFY